MGKFIDRTGEERLNNSGSKMIISRYKSNKNIDLFENDNWTFENDGVVYRKILLYK